MTIDGAYTSNDPKARQYAIERSLRTIDIANALGTKLIVLWLAREGTYLREAKNAKQSMEYLVTAFDKMLAYDKRVRLSAIEAEAERTHGPCVHPDHRPRAGDRAIDARPGSARRWCHRSRLHAILAGLDPADEIEFALTFGKLWSLHLNDQNGLKFDQDKPFGSVSLRSAFDQVRVLERNKYGARGECVCFDVHPFRSTKDEDVLKHLTNSRATFLRLQCKRRARSMKPKPNN